MLALDNPPDSLECPVDLLAGDHQRRADANDVFVGLLGEESLLFQRLAVRTGWAAKFDADPKPLAADLFQVGTAKGLEPLQEVLPQFRRALHHVLFHQNAQRGAGNGARQRIAAEGTAVVAGLENAEDFLRGQHRRDRIEAARQRLARDENVGPNPSVHVSKKLPGTAQAGLNLVGDKEHALAPADLRRFSQESGRRDDDARFALDWL